MSELVVCETVHAISLHVRALTDGEEPCYSGRKNPDARTMCGLTVGWDKPTPIENLVGESHLSICRTCQNVVIERLRT